MVFQGIEGHIITGIAIVFLGIISGYSLNVELRTGLKLLHKPVKAGDGQPDTTPSIFPIYLFLAALLYLPLVWLAETSLRSATIKTEVNLMLLFLVFFFGYLIEKYILRKIEAKSGKNSIYAILIIVMLNILGNIGFLFWDFNTSIVVNETHYTLLGKTLILIFLGYFPIRLVTILLSEEKWLSTAVNIVMLAVYFLLKLLRG